MVKKVLITSKGFIGSTVARALEVDKNYSVVALNKDQFNSEGLYDLEAPDIVINSIGVNRSDLDSDFVKGNVETVARLSELIRFWAPSHANPLHLIHISSTRISLDDIFARTKLEGEKKVMELAAVLSFLNVDILRLCNTFGPLAVPNGNSVVATFIDSSLNNRRHDIHDATKRIVLKYSMDLARDIKELTLGESSSFVASEIRTNCRILEVNSGTHNISVGSLSRLIDRLCDVVTKKKLPSLVTQLEKDIHATIVASRIPAPDSLHKPPFSDFRGVFSELAHFENAAQLSYIKILPGQERGGHFHFSKVEYFILLSGNIVVRNVSIETNETVEFELDHNKRIFVSVPYWSHSLINKSSEAADLIIWSSETFKPNEDNDTYFFQ
jgi:UDP-2-acetamido-2,6-beta-L-arabino-hexul-4-ose reductase